MIPARLLSTLSRLSALRRLPGAYRQLETLYQHQAILAFDADGRVVETDATLQQRLRLGPAQLNGRLYRTLLDPQDTAGADPDTLWWAILRGEASVDCLYFTTADGSRAWFQAQYSPVVDAGGRVRRVVAYAADITDRVHAARARQQEFRALQRLMPATAPAAVPSLSVPADMPPGSVAAGTPGATVAQAAHALSEPLSARRVLDAAGLMDGIVLQTEQLARHAAMQVVRQNDVCGGSLSRLAGEAHSLALRSAEAGREIKQLIGAPVGHTGGGEAHQREADRLVQRTQASARRASTMIDAIAQPEPCKPLERTPRP
ncbi:methyl-accepting chemotaxis protein [Xylophilus ampelinus]|uniref:methyl-accepting chemotaxis protein n=1 Tax=Xylophilus ampelinus TaxID=54067 RepID=UPI0013148715|nr:PAS domain-containing protein [Xylophilus ampelinus]MCS4510726.1 PAS domain-containing protein [Xylophilus ampelinus]